MLKKRYVVIGFLTFCLTAAIFIGATTSQIPYDPWIDHNADGKINYEDLFALADHYGGEGIPINQAAVQFEGNISVPAAAFVPNNNTADWRNWGSYLGDYDSDPADSKWVAAVQLPHGANITKLTSYWWDYGAETIGIQLFRYNLTHANPMASAHSFGDTGPGSRSSTAINFAAVDNNRYAYFMMVDVPGPAGIYYFLYAMIEFEY